MRYISLLLVVSTLFIVSACDRFDHDFETLDFKAELFTPMQSAMEHPEDLSALMAFYADDYVHNAATKADREQFFHSLYTLYGDDVRLIPNLQAYNHHNQSLTWELRVFDPDMEPGLLAVIPFNDEKVLKVGESWKLYGNRIADLEQGNKRRMVFETFTFTTCPNCPQVENVLHGLASLYPTQFSYLEYHFNDPLAIPATAQTFGYYGFSVMPATILNGEAKVIGGDPIHLETIRNAAEGYLNTSAVFLLEDIQTTFTAGTGLEGSLNLEVPEDSKETDLNLRFHLIERSSATTNSIGNACTNVVLASGKLDISEHDLNLPINFSLPFTGSLPSDAALIIFVQKMPSLWADNAPILNAREIDLAGI
jgi:thiol-disulfide isomerase/thioredoxin